MSVRRGASGAGSQPRRSSADKTNESTGVRTQEAWVTAGGDGLPIGSNAQCLAAFPRPARVSRAGGASGRSAWARAARSTARRHWNRIVAAERRPSQGDRRASNPVRGHPRSRVTHARTGLGTVRGMSWRTLPFEAGNAIKTAPAAGGPWVDGGGVAGGDGRSSGTRSHGLVSAKPPGRRPVRLRRWDPPEV